MKQLHFLYQRNFENAIYNFTKSTIIILKYKIISHIQTKLDCAQHGSPNRLRLKSLATKKLKME